MENWQRKYLENNAEELERKTICNDSLLQQLAKDGILADIDVEIIKCNSTPIEQARTLYDIMKIKKDGYTAISKALATCHQIEAYYIIRLGYAECLSADICIDFLGKTKKLSECFNEVEIQEIIECARKKLSENQNANNYINSDICTEQISLVRNTELPSTSLYIPRKLFKRVVINTKLFQNNYPDVFVFKGVQSVSKLSKLVHPQLASSSSLQLRQKKLTHSFILLEHKEHWERISTIVQVPCHLVRYEEDTKSCILERTTGGSEVIGQYLAKPSLEKDAQKAISEDTFIENILADSASRYGICICDFPGMGKTHLLSQIADKLNEKCPDRLVAFISLPHFIKHLTKHGNPLKLDIAHTRNALLEYLSTSPVSFCILDRIIAKFEVSMELLFDGFDEVDFKSVDFTKQFLSQLTSHCPNTRVFVTSRPHMRHELEVTLGVIAFDIMPFTEVNQVEFLVNSWAGEGNEGRKDQTKLKEFAHYCLESLGDMLTKDEQQITGVPLLCRILANVYSRKAKIFCRSPANTLNDVKNSFQFETSLPSLYRKYIEGSFEKLNGSSEASIADVKKYHVCMAFKTLFTEVDFEHFRELSVKFSQSVLNSSISMGLLEKRFVGSKQVVQFVHRTFAEYFLAEFCAETIKSFGQRSKIYDDDHEAEFVLKMVLMTQNIGSLDDIEGSAFIYPVVVYFLNFFTEDLKITSEALGAFAQHFKDSVSPTHLHGMLFGCLRDNHANIFKFITNIFAQLKITVKEQFKTEIIPDGETHLVTRLLNVASVFSSISLVVALFAFFKDNLKLDLESVCRNLSLHLDTPLHFAIEKADVEKTQYFAKIIPLQNRKLLLSCVVNSSEDSPQVVKRKIDMCRLLLSMDKYKELLTEASYILYDSVHVEILKVLIEQGSDLSESKSDENLVYQAAQYMTDDHFAELCRFLIEDVKAYQLFKRNELKWNSPLPRILQRPQGALLLATFKKIFEIPGIDVNEKYKKGNTIILTAVKLGHGEKMISLLESAGADINAVNDYGQNALHLAAQGGNTCVIPFLIKLGVDCRHLDVQQNSFLHCLHSEATAADYQDIVTLLSSAGLTDIFRVRNKRKQLPIHKAVARLELTMETLKVFRAANVDFNSVDEYNSSLLVYAVVERRSVQFLTALICEFDVDVMTKTLKGQTFAHIISEYYTAEQYHELVNTIISTGNRESFMTTDNFGHTPLHWSVHFLELLPETLTLLHDNNMVNFSAVDKHKRTLLYFAVWGGRSVSFLKLLLDLGVNAAIANTEGDTMIHRMRNVYSSKEYHQIMELLIERGYERVYQMANNLGQFPLQLAVAQMQLHEDTLCLIGEKLVKTGIVDINCADQNGRTILHTAIVGFHTLSTISRESPLPILQWDKEEKNFLMYRSIEGSSKSSIPFGKWDGYHLKILIDMGTDITIQDRCGNTIAHYIPHYYSSEQYHEIMEILCRKEHARVFQIVNSDGFTPLYIAVHKLELLDKTLDLINSTLLRTGIVCKNNRNKYGDSILAMAVMGRRNVRFLETLLKLGIDPMIQRTNGSTFAHLIPLYYSPEDYHKVVELIIQTGHERVFQVVNDSGQTPFHTAILHLEVLEATVQLINYSVFRTKIVDIDSRDTNGNSFLMYSANAKRSTSLLENLLNLGIDVTIKNNVGNTFAHEIAANYSPKEFGSLVKLMLETGKEKVCQVVNQKGQSPLHIAFCEMEPLDGTLDLVEHALLKTNIVDINLRTENGHSLIVCAAIGKRSLKFMEAILEMGADPAIMDEDGNNLAHFLPECYTPHEYHSMVQLLIRKGYESIFQTVNKDKRTAVQVAILKLDLVEIRTLDLFNATLFQTGIADINYVDTQGNSLLVYAVSGSKNVNILEKLIKMGVNPMMQNNDGITFAHLVHRFYTPQDYHKILEMIIQTGNEKVFQVVNENKQSPLHAAILNIDLLSVTLDLVNIALFQTNIVNINCQDIGGNSLLANAIIGKRSIRFLEKFIKMGVDPTIQNVYGDTFAHLVPDHYTPQDYHNILELIMRTETQSVFQLVNENGNTPLHTAIQKLELLQASLDLINSSIFQTNIVHINLVDNQGNSFLTHGVIGKRSVSFLENLIKMGVDATIQNKNGNTFAHFLQDVYTPEDYHQIVDLIIKTKNTNILQIVNQDDKTPLHTALQKMELLESTWKLLSSKLFKTGYLEINFKDTGGNSFLAHAVAGQRSVKVLQDLIKMGVDPAIQNEDGYNFAHLSAVYYATHDYHKIVELIIKSGQQESVFQAVNNIGQTPLHIAVNQLELLEETLNLIVGSLLCTKRVDINAKDKDGNSLMVYALNGRRSVEQLENLLKIGVNPTIQNQNGYTFVHLIPLFYSPHQYHKIVDFLIEANQAKVFQVRNSQGRNPLHDAVYHLELLEETLNLLAGIYKSENYELHGSLTANVSTSAQGLNAKDKMGNTVLHWALIGKRSLQFVQHLINLGAAIFVKNNHDSTLTHACASYGLIDHLKYFVDLGCDVNVMDNDGDNVVQCAVCDATENLFEIVSFLVAKGADIRHQNNKGNTAYEQALEKGITNERILNALK